MVGGDFRKSDRISRVLWMDMDLIISYADLLDGGRWTDSTMDMAMIFTIDLIHDGDDFRVWMDLGTMGWEICDDLLIDLLSA